MSIVLLKKGNLIPFNSPDKYLDERELQDLIEENPNVLPLSAAREQRLMTIDREAGNDAGSADLLLTDNEGNVYIVETKLEKNADRRKIVAQLFDYAAQFRYGREPDAFIGSIRDYFAKKSTTLEESLGAKYDLDNVPLLIEKIKDNFEDGSFFLVVAMDKVDEELERMINFINNSKFRVRGYELETYNIGNEQKVIVPRIVGSETETEAAANSAKSYVWDENSFLEYVGKQPLPIKDSVRELYLYAKKKLGFVKLGNAKTPYFKITSKMLGIRSLGPDNVIFQIVANGYLYSRSDYFIGPGGEYSCKSAQHFYEGMKKILGEAYSGWIVGNKEPGYLEYEKWGAKTEDIKNLLGEVVDMARERN